MDTDYFFIRNTHLSEVRLRNEDLGPELRSFPCGDYIILYRIDETVVRVVRIVHGSRDLQRIQP